MAPSQTLDGNHVRAAPSKVRTVIALEKILRFELYHRGRLVQQLLVISVAKIVLSVLSAFQNIPE